jgi:hypothetical protein
VAILKIQRKESSLCWYDFLDSLPLRDTLRRAGETDDEMCHWLGINNLNINHNNTMMRDASPWFLFDRNIPSNSAMSYDDSDSQFESHQHLSNDAGATNTAIVPKTAQILITR